MVGRLALGEAFARLFELVELARKIGAITAAQHEHAAVLPAPAVVAIDERHRRLSRPAMRDRHRLAVGRRPGGRGQRWNGRHRGQRRHRGAKAVAALRSEEHTSELQSLMRISYAVFCLKKKKNIYNI